MRITLALLCCPCSYDLLRLDRGVVETIAALNQVFQPLGKACCRSAVHHPTIKADRLLPSSCPSASLTDLSRRKFTVWTLRGHHKSGPHAHRAITSGQEVRGRLSKRGLHICGSRVEARSASISPVC